MELGDSGYPDEDVTRDSGKMVSGQAVSPGRWTFNDKGLTVNFNSYDVAPYSAGTPEATVPWAKLKDYLTVSATSLLG